MTIETFTIESDNVNGTMRRFVTIIEQRGWYIRSLLIEEFKHGVITRVQVSPYGNGRSIETLRLQIERLHNVRRVIREERSRVKPSLWKEIPYADAV